MLKQAFSLKRNFRCLVQRPADHAPVVDGLRAFAVLVVVVSHMFFVTQFFIPDASQQFERLPGWLTWPIQGFLGVDMFFVISGFLIGGILFREYATQRSLDLKRFFARRFLRLMPLYWVALGLSVLLVAMDNREVVQYVNVEIRQNVHEAWKNLLYINNFFPPQEQFGAMSHSWSLAVEEQFYVLVPLLLLLFFRTPLQRHPWKVAIGATLAYLVIRALARMHSIELFDSQCGVSRDELSRLKVDPLAIFTEEKLHCVFNVETSTLFENLYTKYIPLFFGVASAYLTVFKSEAARAFYARTLRSELLFVLSLGAIAFNFSYAYFVPEGSVFHPLFHTFFQQIVFGLAVTNIIVSAVYATGPVVSLVKAMLSARLLYVIAQLSYSMYLFNLLIVHMSYRNVMMHNPHATLPELILQALPTVTAATLVVSVLAYLFIERPFMNLRERRAPAGAGAIQLNPAAS